MIQIDNKTYIAGWSVCLPDANLAPCKDLELYTHAMALRGSLPLVGLASAIDNFTTAKIGFLVGTNPTQIDFKLEEFSLEDKEWVQQPPRVIHECAFEPYDENISIVNEQFRVYQIAVPAFCDAYRSTWPCPLEKYLKTTKLQYNHDTHTFDVVPYNPYVEIPEQQRLDREWDEHLDHQFAPDGEET